MREPEGEELARIRRGIRRTLNEKWQWTRTEQHRLLSLTFHDGGLYHYVVFRRAERCHLIVTTYPGADTRHISLPPSDLSWNWADERAIDLQVRGWRWVAVFDRALSELAVLRGRLAVNEQRIREGLEELERRGLLIPIAPIA